MMHLTCKTHLQGSGIHPSSDGVARVFVHGIGTPLTVTIASNSMENGALGSTRRVTADDLRVDMVN